MGTVFDIQRFSLHDGPGVRTVVFLKGCPLRCVWCHNPEGLSRAPQILFDPGRCIGCMDCVTACPVGCHTEADGLHGFERMACTACGKCAEGCCTGALSVAGQELSPRQVLDRVLRDRGVYASTRGGLTLSGGEPFAQPEFALELLKLAKEESLHTAVETSGYAPEVVIRQAAAYTDLFLYDYKVTDPAAHQALCGVSNEAILANLALLDSLGASVILRCPIIPGQNDTPDHRKGIGKTAKQYDCIKEVHLQPYHRLGLDKAARLGKDRGFDTALPDKDSMARYAAQIRRLCGKPVREE